MDLKNEIQKDIQDNSIMLYMKGTKEMPMCGFSATIVKILSLHKADFKTVNVLENPNIRVNFLNIQIGLQFHNFL